MKFGGFLRGKKHVTENESTLLSLADYRVESLRATH